MKILIQIICSFIVVLFFWVDREKKRTRSVHNWFNYGYCTFDSLCFRTISSHIFLKGG